tara:strand:- start:404 stop:1207 length:804 start_codon:yes stop_codon:yes gene_type:complete
MPVCLPFDEVSLDIKDEELPYVSINIPCYERREFIPLIIINLMGQNYPKEKLEVCILQDGPQDLFISSHHNDVFREAIYPMTLKYKYEKNIRRTIGEKRNKLVKMSSHKIIASMDSDDIYLSEYIRHSVNALKQFNSGATSSCAMNFIYPKLDYRMTRIHCALRSQCHEACAVFTKKFYNSTGGFQRISQGEGISFFGCHEKKVKNLDINKLMICVCHDENTIDKKQFEDQTEHAGKMIEDSIHIKILDSIFGIKNDKDAWVDVKSE